MISLHIDCKNCGVYSLIYIEDPLIPMVIPTRCPHCLSTNTTCSSDSVDLDANEEEYQAAVKREVERILELTGVDPRSNDNN